ncbi:HTH-type transcriptional regulator [Methyloligella halotolerans]|uniref:HTH-type transcriptional regulator n=1 Tax=Methyloligella halotolerans TaxID=1177755 RepID=A0A1E2S1G4_9HYPH|nr:metalloregulator ArsR/SmtB family transcription factor [Methyloligella halotolerans]ODA68165.1 HTH-type transcriptional regulator [Methyloligella halotolerans]
MSRALSDHNLRAHSASLFAALGDETRLDLLAKLTGGVPRSISALTEGTDLTRQAVTKHLKVLEDAGMVHSARVGRESRYALEPKAIDDLKAYLDLVSAHWDDALSRLKTMVESDLD